MTRSSPQLLALAATALLALMGSSPAHAANHPSLTGRPQALQNDHQDAVLKSALRQRNNLPVTEGTGRRLGQAQRKLPDSKGPGGSKHGESDDKPPPPPSSGYAGGYYPPPPSGGGSYPGMGGYPGSYYPPAPEGTGGTGGYYPPATGGTGGYNPPSSTTSPQQNYHQNDDIPLLDDAMFDDAFYAKDACQLVTFNESFFFEAAPVQLGVAGGRDVSEVGSQFLFAQNIYTPDGTMINDTLLSGSCTRTSANGLLGTSGAGFCQFNFVDVHGNYTIAAQGHLDTISSQVSAGNLVVTGGSGSMVSVVGEMNVVPVDETGMFTTKDIFTGIYAYFIQAAFGVIICPPLKGHSS